MTDNNSNDQENEIPRDKLPRGRRFALPPIEEDDDTDQPASVPAPESEPRPDSSHPRPSGPSQRFTRKRSDSQSAETEVVTESAQLESMEPGSRAAYQVTDTQVVNDQVVEPIPLDWPEPSRLEPVATNAQGDSNANYVDRRAKRRWTEKPRVFVLYYSAAFIVAELVGAALGIEYQLFIDALGLIVAFNHALFGYRNARTASVVMTALFCSRLIALGLPIAAASPLTDTGSGALFSVSPATRTAIVAIFSIAIARLAVWVLYNDVNETRANEGFNLKRPIISKRFTSILVAASGVPIGVAAWFLLKPEPFIVMPLFGTLLAAWAVVLMLLAIGAVSEELLYRQLVAAMVQHTGSSQTALVSGALFASIYFGTLNPAFILLAFATGCWFAWSCERTGSLQGPVIAHVIINGLVFALLPGTHLF